MGDLPGDLKWEFGGAVFRVPGLGLNEYAVYSSLWVLLPDDDPVGARVTPPFQSAAGGMNGGPIMTLQGEDINMLFLPKGVRPGDILEVGDTVAFSGHVGPPLDSRVEVTITPPSGSINAHSRSLACQQDRLACTIPASTLWPTSPVVGRWMCGWNMTGLTCPQASHQPASTQVLCWAPAGRYEFYVVEPGAPRLFVFSPKPGFVNWPSGQIEPIHIRGSAPPGTADVYYTIHDKGVVMGQGDRIPRCQRYVYCHL